MLLLSFSPLFRGITLFIMLAILYSWYPATHPIYPPTLSTFIDFHHYSLFSTEKVKNILFQTAPKYLFVVGFKKFLQFHLCLGKLQNTSAKRSSSHKVDSPKNFIMYFFVLFALFRPISKRSRFQFQKWLVSVGVKRIDAEQDDVELRKKYENFFLLRSIDEYYRKYFFFKKLWKIRFLFDFKSVC